MKKLIELRASEKTAARMPAAGGVTEGGGQSFAVARAVADKAEFPLGQGDGGQGGIAGSAGGAAAGRVPVAQGANEAMIHLRVYQVPILMDHESGILILHWSRQIGKSYTLAAWAIDRLLAQLEKYDAWLITVLSNSRDNGAEFLLKCSQVSELLELALERPGSAAGQTTSYHAQDDSPDLKFENMRMEVRITRTREDRKRSGRIKVLAANPRTARGFSGDLILDEFAFHEDSNAIWEAAEPILSANPEFLCRIASTGNGKHNMFYRMASGERQREEGRMQKEEGSVVGSGARNARRDRPEAGSTPNNGVRFVSAGGFLVSRVTRTEAWKMGVQVYDSNTRKPVAPHVARAQAQDKRAYDQNYECLFAAENMTLLTHELISAAERSLITIDAQEWSAAARARMFRAQGRLEAGNDIGRNRDLSMITVIERVGTLRRVIAMLRMENLRLPDQQKQCDCVCEMPKFACYCGDMTGLGLGLVEYLQEKWGMARIMGVNFSSTEPTTERIAAEGRRQPSARVTEIMATNLLAVFEDRAIEIPAEQELRDDLRKPEKITSPGGRVSIAATRDEAGHADGFWSLALAIRAGDSSGGPFAYAPVTVPGRTESLTLRGKGVTC